jgi:polysaccharide export outer membrane protein
LPLEQAERRIAEALRETDKAAEVDLRLSQTTGRCVSVLGAFAKPGCLALTSGMRVTDLIAAAGGILTVKSASGAPPLEVADLDASVLLRDGKALPISLREALQGKVGHNVYVCPGDQLYIPFATGRTVAVFGQVGRPSMLVHRSGMRLTEALSAAGGINTGGDKGDIRLVRGPVERPKVYQASLRAIAAGDAHDVALAPGDVLFVTDHRLEDVGEVLQLLVPLGAIGLAVLTIALIASY